MKDKKKKPDRRAFKMTPEQLDGVLKCYKRTHTVPMKKGKGSYNRQKFKRGDRE